MRSGWRRLLGPAKVLAGKLPPERPDPRSLILLPSPVRAFAKSDRRVFQPFQTWPTHLATTLTGASRLAPHDYPVPADGLDENWALKAPNWISGSGWRLCPEPLFEGSGDRKAGVRSAAPLDPTRSARPISGRPAPRTPHRSPKDGRPVATGVGGGCVRRVSQIVQMLKRGKSRFEL